jgi:O-antigen biosynthesis protein
VNRVPRVHVVLASFEPRPDWFEAQVTSILTQADVDLTLDVSDDGSGPEAQALLASLLDADPRCTWSSGARVGSAANFARALARAPRDVDAVLLADQDDVWYARRAAHLVAALDEGHLLVHGDADLIDASGARLGTTLFDLERRDPHALRQEQLVVKNVVTGCTVALRPELLDAALPLPSVVGGPVHHDLWLALCAAGLGSIGVVTAPLLAYRQHADNVVGAVTDYGRWEGAGRAIGAWLLRQRIAAAVVETAAAGRIPPPSAAVTAWVGARPELATLSVLRAIRRDPALRGLARTLRAGALLHLARRLARAPLHRIRRTGALTGRVLRLLGHIVRNPRRMLGGIARAAGIVAQPLRTVSATPLDPQQRPLRARIDGSGRTVHLLIPGISPSGVFGGVGTAVALAVLLADAGEQVQLVLTDYGQTLDERAIRALILRHVDTDASTLERIRIAHAIHDDRELLLGTEDVFIATAWWTAFRAAATIDAHEALTNRRFVYLVQDDETLFYPTSERQLMAERSYRLDVLPLVNSRPLAIHLAAAHALAADEGLVFAPIVAVPTQQALRAPEDVLRVVVYGRPSVGRNLFDASLRGIAMWEAQRRAHGLRPDVEVVSVGEQEQFRYRIGERMVRALGVLSWDAYLEVLASAHIGVSMMTSPHPSYPPLEMARSGMVVVTNRWGPKDLETLSTRFVSCDPDAAGIAAALTVAEDRLGVGGDPELRLAELGRPLADAALLLRERIAAGALR